MYITMYSNVLILIYFILFIFKMGCHQICNTSNEDTSQLTIFSKENKEKTNTKLASDIVNDKQLTGVKSLALEEIGTERSKTRTKSKNDFEFKIEASNIHRLIPIWIEKDQKILFNVEGQWGFEEYEEEFDSYGCGNFEEKPKNHQFGCLLGYITGGEYFMIYNDLEYTAEKSGGLFVFQNNGLFSITPKGSLTLKLKGDQLKISTPVEIEQKLGWDLELIDTSIPEMKEKEKMLLILINKVRTNPKLFTEQFLYSSDVNHQGINEQELIDELLNMSPVSLLKTNSRLYNVSLNHARDIGENHIVGHQSSNGYSLEERLSMADIPCSVYAENCIFGYNDPLEIILTLLIDENNEDKNQRRILLSNDFNSVGLVIEPHKDEFVWSCVQDFIYLDEE